jgi:hypothetical protein
MAVWEYCCTLLPIASVGLLSSLTPGTIGDIDSLGLWAKLKVPEFLSAFPSELERSKGWTENLTILRIGPTCTVRVYAHDDEILDVQAVIDLREKFLSSLEFLVDVCKRNRWVFVDNSLKVMSSSADALIDSIRSSSAAQFVRDPVRFLTQQKPDTSP